jgi:hypothetical protein
MIDRVDDTSDGALAVTVGEMQILIGLAPSSVGADGQRAEFVDDFPSVDDRMGSGYVGVAVTAGGAWPSLVVTQRFAPAGPGFTPGILVVPAERQLFIGAGTRLLAYEARSGRWRRCWVDEAEFGFWGWRQHGDVVVMSAELELAAWTTHGDKLWTTFVEPPWSYRVVAGRVELDVMGAARTFDLRTGPPPRA